MSSTESNTDYSNSKYNKVGDKPSEIFRFHFYSDERYAFINISPKIIQQLHLTESDSVLQFLSDEGDIILRKVPRV